ncbi:hypothetical protein HJC99_06735 [Candidatus Saccharibacteria bacterium]|nr:hypothetical protein [Candidatus Saccharibacteria bacterium]
MSRETPVLETAWHMWRATVNDLRRGWLVYGLTILVVTLPVRLLSLSSSLTADGSFSTFSAVLSFILNLALLAVAGRRYHDEPVTVGDAYFDGTKAFVRYLVTSFMLTLALFPLGLGLIFFRIGVSASPALGETLLIAAVALAISLPSLWLLIRFSLAPVIAANTNLRPIASLRLSRQLTLGRFWSVTRRYTVLVLWLLVIGTALTFLLALIGSVYHDTVVLNSLYAFVLSLVGLPLGSIYLTRLYNRLSELNE